jgi:L-ascorbate metabolism protein UlaG (beta-lactamase superfamily)
MAKTSTVLTAVACGAALAAAGVAWTSRDLRAQLGATPAGARAERMRQSPQFRDGVFRNRQPATVLPPGSMRDAFRELLFGKQRRKPVGVIPVLHPGTSSTATGGLEIIWYGHSTALVEIEGVRVLLDPVWSDRCSPSRLIGPRRLHAMPLGLDELPPLDAIVISHDHYDHLDMTTIRALARLSSAPMLVPLGVGAHLERWGVPSDRIIELDWEESFTVRGVRLVATPARHFSGRGFSRDGTLWASWVIAGAQRRVFYTGDSGFFDGYAEIGAAHGPFDASLVQIGAYSDGWPDIHMTPEEGASAHVAVNARLMIPLHWCTFVLAMHDWSEPVERLWHEAKARDITLVVPRPGERIDVDAPPTVDGWWQTIA